MATRTTNTATIPSGFFHVFAVCFISYPSLLVQLTGVWIPTILWGNVFSLMQG